MTEYVMHKTSVLNIKIFLSFLFISLNCLLSAADTTNTYTNEEQQFLDNKFKKKHYLKAKKLNLDLKNYKLYRERKKKLVGGTIMSIAGYGLGVPSFLIGSITTTVKYYQTGYVFLDTAFLGITGAFELLLGIYGTRNINNAKKITVKKKDGSMMYSLHPYFYKDYSGVMLTLRF
jgi:hypothetical protein